MNLTDKIKWLSQFYSIADINKLSNDRLDLLYADTQPTKEKIQDLSDVSNLLVKSEDGFVAVHKWRNKGIKPCYTIKTKSHTLSGSNDHFVELHNGKWKYLKYIEVGDMLKTESGIEPVTEHVQIEDSTVYDFHINHANHRYYTAGISSHNSGSGKSLIMQNLAVNWAMASLNGVYVSMELSEGLCSMRMDSMITGVPSNQIFKDIDDVELKVKMFGKKAGDLRIKYLPAGSTVNDMRAYFKELQVQTGNIIDFVCVDYLDLANPAGVKVNPSDQFIKDKYVSEEFRNLAKELNILFITASQLNRCLVLCTKVIANNKEIEIKDVQVGDWLDSNNGAVQVYEKLPITRQKVYKIKTKSGKEIICSAEHKFPTTNGLRSINSGLQQGDTLYSNTVEQNTKVSVAEGKKE